MLLILFLNKKGNTELNQYSPYFKVNYYYEVTIVALVNNANIAVDVDAFKKLAGTFSSATKFKEYPEADFISPPVEIVPPTTSAPCSSPIIKN